MQAPDNFVYVITVEHAEEMLHAPEHPYCWNQTCPCKANTESYLQVQQFVNEGLMTPDEAVIFIAGKTV